MQQNNEIKKTPLWNILFIIPPTIIIINLNKEIRTFISVNQMILAAFLGILGVLIGTTIFKLVDKKTAAIKIIVWVIMMASLFGLLFFCVQLSHQQKAS